MFLNGKVVTRQINSKYREDLAYFQFLCYLSIFIICNPYVLDFLFFRYCLGKWSTIAIYWHPLACSFIEHLIFYILNIMDFKIVIKIMTNFREFKFMLNCLKLNLCVDRFYIYWEVQLLKVWDWGWTCVSYLWSNLYKFMKIGGVEKSCKPESSLSNNSNFKWPKESIKTRLNSTLQRLPSSAA